MPRHAFVEHFVVHLVGCAHQRNARHLQRVHRGQDVFGQQGDVLNALAVELHQELFDLPRTAAARLFIQRNADQVVGRRHRLAGQAGVFALDVEVADLTEVEQALIEARPIAHATPVHVVGEVVDELETMAYGVALVQRRKGRQELEVDVVDALAVFEAVDEVQGSATNALDGRQPQLHGPCGHLHRLGPQVQGARIGLMGVPYAKRQGAGTGPMLGGKVARQAAWLAVDDEIDVALAKQHHVFAAVLRHQGKAHALEQGLQQTGLG